MSIFDKFKEWCAKNGKIQQYNKVKNLLSQLPDQNVKADYYFDELTKIWKPLSEMDIPQQLKLDENKNLAVETPNKYVIEETWDYRQYYEFFPELDFLADSITITIVDKTGTISSGTIDISYYISENTSIEIFSLDISGTGDHMEQYDCKPFDKFKVYFNNIIVEGADSLYYRIIFSKQKKTKISDTAYGATWDTVDDIGASKNALYDKISVMISDVAYNATTWDTVDTIAPSKNAIRDKIVAMDATIALNTTEAEVLALISAECGAGESIDNAIDVLISDHAGVATAHHTATVAGDLNHNDLANLNAGTDYEHITQTQKDALHTAVVAGDLNHNDLANLNAGTSYEHITQTQKDALHAVLTNLTQLSTRNHNDLQNINAGTDYEHITQTQKDALHAVLTNLTQLTTRLHSSLQSIGVSDHHTETFFAEGTYEGTGLLQSITGLGFQPKIIWIYDIDGTETLWYKHENMGEWYSARADMGQYHDTTCKITSDGFDVNENGNFDNWNYANHTYVYYALR